MRNYCQTVPPDKTTKETIYVSLVVFAIIVCSGIFIHFHQRTNTSPHTLAAYEISARYDLKAAEQGILADLLLIYQDWQDHPDSTAPSVATLIEENWPPFTDKLENKQRGSHHWQQGFSDGQTFYLGLTQYPDIARHLLWILPNDKTNADNFDVWVYSQAMTPPTIQHLEPDQLAAMGWKKINRNSEIKR